MPAWWSGPTWPQRVAILALLALGVWLLVLRGDDGDARRPATPPPAEPEGRAEEPSSDPEDGGDTALVVARVVDGDTLDLENGVRVRLVQIDSPEVGEGECFADEATRALAKLVPPGTRVQLEADPLLDDVDRYGRQLRYVWRGRTNVNLTLVRDGAASVWFYDGARGRYARSLLAAAADARRARRGLWEACAGASLDPLHAVQTAAPAVRVPAVAAASSPTRCDRSYRGACVPLYPPDVDCPDVAAEVEVAGADPHRLDSDGDGRGCEGW